MAPAFRRRRVSTTAYSRPPPVKPPIPLAIVSGGRSTAVESSLQTIRCGNRRIAVVGAGAGRSSCWESSPRSPTRTARATASNNTRSASARPSSANQEDSARAFLPRAPRPAVDQRREMLLHLVEIADRMLVQNDDVGLQALKPPVLLRLKHLTHERQVIVLDDLDEQDRQIAGHAVRPQALLAAPVLRQRRRRRLAAIHPDRAHVTRGDRTDARARW